MYPYILHRCLFQVQGKGGLDFRRSLVSGLHSSPRLLSLQRLVIGPRETVPGTEKPCLHGLQSTSNFVCVTIQLNCVIRSAIQV